MEVLKMFKRGNFMKTKLYIIAAILCYLAAIGFFVAAIIGKSTLYVIIGLMWICIGTLDLVLSRIRNDN